MATRRLRKDDVVILQRQRTDALAGRGKIAFSTAGAATAIVGSPTPPQKPPDGTIVSTAGISSMRHRLIGVEVLLLDAATLDGALAIEQADRP
jgi:hypothetical protein